MIPYISGDRDKNNVSFTAFPAAGTAKDRFSFSFIYL